MSINVRRAKIDLEKHAPPSFVCKRIGPDRTDGNGNPAEPITMPGAFNGWMLVKKNGKPVKVKTDNYCVAVDWDGYCEIPITKYNKAQLKRLTKPHKRIQKYVPQDTPLDPITGRPTVVKEREYIEPALFVKLPESERRGYEVGKRNSYHPESAFFDIMRPWARNFIQVQSLMSESKADSDKSEFNMDG